MSPKKAATKKTTRKKKTTNAGPKRKYLKQADVPGYSLDQALRVPRALVENYAGGPSTPLRVASVLKMAPGAGPFRQLTGAAIAYGLTSGGYNAAEIALQPLARRILKPKQEGDDLAARREALLKPRVLGEFLTKYSGSQLPRQDIAQNVLEDMGVPVEKTTAVYELILESARSVGLVQEINGKSYVDLDGVPVETEDAEEEGDSPVVEPEDIEDGHPEDEVEEQPEPEAQPDANPERARRVFITHGKNKSFIDPIKKLLGFGELIPVVSVDKQSVSKPVPDKVMEDMRTCGAAIIHVEAEKRLIDNEANEHSVINPNVLIEIGAAMALYGRRFILLVREGVDLPSNLQGLYEVRYGGETLDGNATIRLLEAINDIKNHEIPTR